MMPDREFKTRVAWSDADVARLLKMRADGVSINSCASILGRTRDAIVVKLRNPHGAALKPWTEAERARLWQMLGAGYGLTEISEALGRSYYSCRNQARNGRNYVEANRERADEARELGRGRDRDSDYSSLCRDHGGFWAFSERRFGNNVVVCLPLLPPGVSA